MIFLTCKEELDLELLLKLRKQDLIITPGQLFEGSQKQEINNLITKEIFNFE
jgi:hypothetical protein